MSFINLGKKWFWFLINFIIYLRRSANSAMSYIDTKQKEAISDVACDDFEYDSRWEDESKAVEKKEGKPNKLSHRNMYAVRDMEKFQLSCQNLDDDGDQTDMHKTFHHYNLEFYRGSRRSEPDNEYIDAFHNKWKGRYDKLERVHSYIQWLFPIQERGMNWQSYVLTKEEIKLFRKDDQAQNKLVKSYELMLDFYGIRLVNKDTGEVKRAENWMERFGNLNRNTHNNLRITRILKCLGTLGFEHYQAKLVKFFLYETLVEKNLPNVKESVLDYFMFTVLNKSERENLIRFAFEHFEPREEFVWGEGMPCININTAKGTRKDSSEQESVSSQSSLKGQYVTGMENKTMEQSSTENDQMQRELAASDMPSELTSNESDETIQDVSETHQVSSNSASDEERGKNGCDVQQQECFKMGLNI